MLYYALKNQANHMHNTCIHVQKHNCLGQGDKEGGGGGGVTGSGLSSHPGLFKSWLTVIQD